MLQWTTGQYGVVRDLGSGDLGTVTLVRNRFERGRILALKQFHSRELSPESIADLRAQILRLRQIRHANVAWVHDVHFDQSENVCVITTEFVEGTNIHGAAQDQGRAVVQDLILQTLHGLSHAHSRGVLHNDLRPSNVLVTQEDGGARVKLVDFIPAQMHREGLLGSGEEARDYQAPERREGGPASERSDLFSVGVILRELLDLTDGGTVDDISADALYRVAERLTAVDPQDRLVSAHDAIRAIAAETGNLSQPEEKAVDRGLLLSGHFVGRTRELRQLEDVAKRVLCGEGGGMVLLEGEPGMGKSRLLDELRVVSQLSGIRVFTTKCRLESESPLTPISDLLRQVATTLHVDHPAVLEFGAVLSSILPGLVDASLAAALPELPPDQHWMRIKNGLVDFLARASETRPILLIIDDFHWIDESSLSLVNTVSSVMTGLPVIVVAALARSQLEHASAAPSLCEVAGGPDREILNLGPLNPDAVRDLVASVFSLPEQGNEISGLITRLTGGVPLYIEELIRSFVDGETVSFGEQGQHLVGTGGSADAHGEVTRLLNSRLERLPATARTVLECLTIFERPVSAEMVTFVSGAGSSQVKEAVRLLQENALVWSTRFMGGRRVEIRNALLRETVFGRIDHPVIVQFHDRALGHLRDLEEDGATVGSAELAYHALRGSALRPALEYAMRAAQEASALHAYDKARRFFWTALEKAEELGDQGTVAEILSEMAETQERLGDLDGALDSLGRLRVLRPTDVPTLVRLGDINRLQGRYDEAEEILRTARALAGGTDDPLLQCRVERAIANSMYRRGRYIEALSRLQQAASTLRQHDARLELARTYTTIGLIHWYHGDLADALASHRQALGIYLQLRDHVGVATSHVNMGLVCWNRGHLAEALNRYLRAERIARRVGHYLILAVSLHNRGIIEFEQGSLEEARRTLAESLQMRGRLADKAGQAKAMDTLGLVHLHAGRYREALRLIRDSIDWRHKLGDLQGMANSRVNLGLVMLDLWDLGQARSLFEAASVAAEELGTRGILGEALLGLAETALREKRPGEALRYTWRARRVYKDLGQEPDIAQCELMIVRLSLEDGRPDLARRTLARAMRRLHRAGTAWLVTQGRFLCGVVRGSSGGVCSLRGALRRADRLGFRDLSWRTRLAAGRILWEDNRKAEAVPHVRRAMEVLRDLNRELPAEHQQPFLLDPDKQRLRLLLHRLLPHMELQNR